MLPPPTHTKGRLKKIVFTLATDPHSPVVRSVDQLPQLQLQMVSKTTSALWNEYIERYHYLGYIPLPGAQLRYFITAGKQIVALAGFGAAAWQTAPRDQFIGWNHDQRKKNLNLITNNARFLILPWVKSRNIASKILSFAYANFRMIGKKNIISDQSYWNLLCRKIDLPALAIKQPTGRMSDKPKVVENLDHPEKSVFLLKISGCILLIKSLEFY